METAVQRNRVLIVDDDQSIRFMMSRVLEREDFLVDCARDGFEAIELLKENDYNVVFLDLMLPRIDGYGVLNFLRGSRPEQLSDVVIMTAGTTETVRDHAGATMTKPFDLDELRANARRAPTRRFPEPSVSTHHPQAD